MIDTTDAHVQEESLGVDPSLILPHQSSAVPYFAVDIGGSLIKMVQFVPASTASTATNSAATTTAGAVSGGKLVFRKFETRDLASFITHVQRTLLLTPLMDDGGGGGEEAKKMMMTMTHVRGTGGGSLKHGSRLETSLGLRVEHRDELACLVRGSNFLLQHVPHESFVYDASKSTSSPEQARAFSPAIPPSRVFPYLLVSVGSGVSILRVDSEDSFTRISGSSVGGGTFWGLCRLLTGVATFDDALALTAHGDHTSVDMLVGDIYGRDYQVGKLSADTIASSFGKASYFSQEEVEEVRSGKRKGAHADLAHALLGTVCNNLAQIAYLNAQKENLARIYFGGFFIRDHPTTMAAISWAIGFWSAGAMQAYFFRHEGYLGALGAFLDDHPPPPPSFSASASASVSNASL
eukprot:ANDGO_04290.mRNA.1 Pantothenate kinase 2